MAEYVGGRWRLANVTMTVDKEQIEGYQERLQLNEKWAIDSWETTLEVGGPDYLGAAVYKFYIGGFKVENNKHISFLVNAGDGDEYLVIQPDMMNFSEMYEDGSGNLPWRDVTEIFRSSGDGGVGVMHVARVLRWLKINHKYMSFYVNLQAPKTPELTSGKAWEEAASASFGVFDDVDDLLSKWMAGELDETFPGDDIEIHMFFFDARRPGMKEEN